jgi:hypothetical protein
MPKLYHVVYEKQNSLSRMVILLGSSLETITEFELLDHN